MKSNYIDSAYRICDLISKNDLETLEKEFPAVIKDLDFILFMSKIYHDVFNIKYDQYYRFNYFISVLRACNDIHYKKQEVFKDKELVKMIFLDDCLDGTLAMLFNPKSQKKDPSLGASYLQTFLLTYDHHKVEIQSEKIKKLFSIIDEVIYLYYGGNKDALRIDHYSMMLLFYGHMYGNYNYLYNYLDNREYYINKIRMNGYVDRITSLYALLFDDANDIFNDINKIFTKRKKEIK